MTENDSAGGGVGVASRGLEAVCESSEASEGVVVIGGSAASGGAAASDGAAASVCIRDGSATESVFPITDGSANRSAEAGECIRTEHAASCSGGAVVDLTLDDSTSPRRPQTLVAGGSSDDAVVDLTLDSESAEP
eukprot:CAMPEP_0184725286 /NCGR_PEP_ID=MMETSP0314-20130426/30527_1 /TAXON_ID=38298 /ORGANISM="Rhodella maculata, Strain CCMP 736" /LENGTH=134 /DNA_ID=CAMNT_0027190479 /DNA_START=167 /DNA_END=571 /DNA_ORIENTATION=+